MKNFKLEEAEKSVICEKCKKSFPPCKIVWKNEKQIICSINCLNDYTEFAPQSR